MTHQIKPHELAERRIARASFFVAVSKALGLLGIVLGISVTTFAAVPPLPANLSPGSTSSPGPTLSSSTVTLSWSASSGATSYEVAVRDLGSNVLVVDNTTSGTSFTATAGSGRTGRPSGTAAGRTGSNAVAPG